MKVLVIFLSLINLTTFGQVLTGPELLQKAIAHHDPNGYWNDFKGQLVIDLTTPDGKSRTSEISLDLRKSSFKLIEQTEVKIERQIEDEDCSVYLNGESDFTESERDKYRLTCEQSEKMRDYYTYLYGLPMKLSDNGTIVHNEVEHKVFQGNEYQVIKVTYEAAVGKDTWYFYFDPETYEMKLYQFFHDEKQNDGEYILLSDVIEFKGMKIPKVRKWYTNKEGKYLGTDLLMYVR